MEKIKQKIVEHGLIKWLPLIVLSSALMIIIIDTTVLNVSIRNMITDLDTTVQDIQWVISAYSLVLAAFTILGGRLGDFFGRKKMFVIGAITFAIGSLITALAPNVTWILIGNALVEGLGAAMMMPATASLLVNHYRGKDRATAFAIWGATAASAAAIGPIVGGWLTSHYSWRWAFGINLIVVALLILGAKFLHEARDNEEKPQLDIIGVLLSSAGLTSLVYGLVKASTYGWWMSKTPFVIFGQEINPFGLSITPVAMVIGLILLILFAIFEWKRESSDKTPLISLSLFSNKQFTSGALTTALMALGQSGLFFAIPIFFQAVLGLDAFQTGIGFLPLSAAVMIGAPISLKLLKLLPPKRIIQIGFVINMLGVAYLYASLNTDSTRLSLTPGLFLFGLGMGFGMSQLGNLTLSAVSVDQAGEASGVNNTLRQVGASFGSAIIGTAMITAMSGALVDNINHSTVIPTAIKPGIVKVVEAKGSNIEFEQPKEDRRMPQAIKNEILKATHEATVEANKTSLLMTGIASFIALSFSFLLPNIRNLETGKHASHKPVARH